MLESFCRWPVDSPLFAWSARTVAASELGRVAASAVIALSCFAIAATLTTLSGKLKALGAARISLYLGAFFALTGALCLCDACAPWFSAPLAGDVLRAAAATALLPAAIALPGLLPRAAALVRAARLAQERGRKLEAAHRDLDAAVARAKELETQLFANVGHELRTPLALILGPTERLLTSPDLRSEQRADLEVVARNARTLVRHVGDLLHAASSEAGQLAASYREVDLAELVRATGAHFDGFAADRRIAYTIDAPITIPAEVDAGKLQRAILNLLSNAFKFTPIGGRVRCSVRELSGDRIVVEVADSGPGIPVEERDAVFERFRHREDGATRRFGGTGLGLAMVRDFVELMRGMVTIGDAPEGGTLVRLELPTLAPPGAVVTAPEDSEVMLRAMVREALDGLSEPSPPSVPAAVPSQPDRPLVLVVEDNPDMNRFVAATLAPEFRVVTALDGQRGLDEALRLRPDLVVSDVMMPGLSGDALVRELRARPELEGLPVVVLTAKTDDALRVRLLREGALDYLNKPFYAEELPRPREEPGLDEAGARDPAAGPAHADAGHRGARRRGGAAPARAHHRAGVRQGRA